VIQYAEYVPAHFKIKKNSNLVHDLPTPNISQKSTYNFLSYHANKKTKQTDKQTSDANLLWR